MLSCLSRQTKYRFTGWALAKTMGSYFFGPANSQRKFAFDRVPKLFELFVFLTSLINIAGERSEKHQKQYCQKQNTHDTISYRIVDERINDGQYKTNHEQAIMQLIGSISSVHKTRKPVFEIFYYDHSLMCSMIAKALSECQCTHEY